MKKNINTKGRIIRFCFALVCLVLAWWWHSWLALGVALFTFYEAAASWCVYYHLIGKNECPLASNAGTTTNLLNASKAKGNPTMSFAQVNGQKLYYEIHGEGHPLVLINGFSSDSTLWKPILETLAKQYQVLIFDNRNVGRSSDLTSTFTTDDMAEDAMGLVDILQLKRPHILGHSLGGGIAQTIAYKYPQKVDKLILCCTTQKFNTRSLMTMDFTRYLLENKVPFDKVVDSILPWFYSNAFLGNSAALQMVKHFLLNNPHPQSLNGFKCQMHALANFDSTSWVDKITAPTLIVSGGEDLLCLNEQHELKRKITQATLVHFPEVGHSPFIEQPEKFLKTVLTFLH